VHPRHHKHFRLTLNSQSVDADMHKMDSTPQHSSPRRSTDLKMQVHELIQISHDLAADENEETIDAANHSENTNIILFKDLPKLLAEFERVKGKALLNEEARPVLDQYVQASPDLPLEADSLLEMIKMLNAAQESNQEDNGYSEEERDVMPNGYLRRQSGASDSETDMSTEDDQSQSDTNNDPSHRLDLEKGPSAPSTRHFEFPRSNSERYMTTSSGAIESAAPYEISSSNRRKKTTSDPSAPSLDHRPRSSSNSKSKTERQRNGESVDRDVLRGKGKAKAPPSSWPNARPRPPAIARRNRRVSDISSNQSDNFEQDQDYVESSSPLPTSSSQYSQVGMGTPSESFQRAPRQRMSSQPEVYKVSSAGKFPRSISSASSGFVFPRANAAYGEESGENLNSDGWDHVSGELASSPLPRSASGVSVPRNGSDRAGSPSLDETSYQNFNALSPFATPASPGLDNGGDRSRRSSGAGRRRNGESDVGEETMIDGSGALRARLEAAQRQLQEKDRQNDAVQQEHEMLISRLQDELEDTKAQITARKKEVKDSKARENSHMDSIATLEADLNKTEKALETTRDHLTKAKIDYDEQIVETNRLRVKVSELQDDLQRYKAEERIHVETVRAWEGDRETYRKTIKELHEHVDEVEAELRRLQEGERENRVLKEQMERMTAELEEVRRGSSFRGSHIGSDVDGTLSKRLGSELAREIAKGTVRIDDDSDAIREDRRMAESDDSVDTTFIIQKIKKKDKVEGSAVDSAPPPYNEAALEKQLSDRLHPLLEIGQQAETSVKDQSYRAILQRTGRRCTVLEESLRTYEREHVDSVETVPNDAPMIVKSSWEVQVMKSWEDWTHLILAAREQLSSLFHSTTVESKRKDSKVKDHQVALLTTAVLVFAIGLGLGLLFSTLNQPKTLYDREEDFAMSRSLELFPEKILHAEEGLLRRILTFTDGRPISRMPT
jgi:competence protein ComGF